MLEDVSDRLKKGLKGWTFKMVGEGAEEKMSSLQGLDLSDTKVTDDGLVHLETLYALQWIDLKYTLVTDAGLEHLAKLTSLQDLYLTGTKVTDEGVKRLQAQLPKCEIHF